MEYSDPISFVGGTNPIIFYLRQTFVEVQIPKKYLKTEPGGSVGRAGTPQSSVHEFNPRLGPIMTDSKTLRVFM